VGGIGGWPRAQFLMFQKLGTKKRLCPTLAHDSSVNVLCQPHLGGPFFAHGIMDSSNRNEGANASKGTGKG